MRYLRSAMIVGLAAAVVSPVVFLASCRGGGGGGGTTGPAVDNSRVSGTYSFVLMSANTPTNVLVGIATFNGAGGGTYLVTSPITTSDSFTYVARVDNALVIDGALIGSLRNGGSFFTVVDTFAGKEQMMVGVKQSGLLSDMTTTYITGQFRIDAGTSEANIVQINTSTPSDGNVTYSLLTGGTATGTDTYTFDTNSGTITLADAFNAITSDRQLIILGDGETAVSTEISGYSGLKQPGIAMSDASLNGTYLLYSIADENAGGVPQYVTTRAIATFDGAGHGTFTELAKSFGTLHSKPSITYAVDPSGAFSINGNGAQELGTILEDGSVFGMVWFDSTTGYASVGIGIKQ